MALRWGGPTRSTKPPVQLPTAKKPRPIVEVYRDAVGKPQNKTVKKNWAPLDMPT